jgi:HSP20 family protein
LFDDFFNNDLTDWRRTNFSSTGTTLPKVNIKENDDSFAVEMAAPGMEKKDFEIHVENGILTISSEKKDEVKEEKENFTRREFSFQSFQRSFTLPDTVDGEKIKDRYENGLLMVTIPKKEEAKPKPPKKITVG